MKTTECVYYLSNITPAQDQTQSSFYETVLPLLFQGSFPPLACAFPLLQHVLLWVHQSEPCQRVPYRQLTARVAVHNVSPRSVVHKIINTWHYFLLIDGWWSSIPHYQSTMLRIPCSISSAWHSFILLGGLGTVSKVSCPRTQHKWRQPTLKPGPLDPKQF